MSNFIEKLLFKKYLQPGEKIQYIVHRHFWSIWKQFTVKVLFFLVIPITIYVFFPNPYVFYGMLALNLYGLGSILYLFIDWYADAFILTDRNVIDVEWNGIFKKESRRINYNDIESVQANVNGIARTLFKFGYLVIETANESTDVVLPDASNISDAQDKIINMKKIKESEDTHAQIKTFKTALHHFMNEYTQENK